MALEVLSYGVPYTIADSGIRALPSPGGHLYATASTATSIDFSNSPTMANVVNVIATAGSMFGNATYSNEQGIRVSSGFLRVIGGSAIVKIVKP